MQFLDMFLPIATGGTVYFSSTKVSILLACSNKYVTRSERIPHVHASLISQLNALNAMIKITKDL